MYWTRREFLQNTGMTATIVAAGGLTWAEPVSRSIGLQMYTVRQDCEKDFPLALHKVREIGYREVELAGFYNLQPQQLQKLLLDIGLSAPAAHFVYRGDDDWARSVDDSKTVGAQYIVCPVLPVRAATGGIEPSRGLSESTADDFNRGIANLNRMAERAQKAGLTFVYHNHNYEFRKLGDATGFEMLLRQTDPKLVKLELDVFWLAEAGLDPVKTIAEQAGRVALLHIKDRKPGAPNTFIMEPASAAQTAEVGSGTMDWPAIFAAGAKAGVRHSFVEQDISSHPMQSAKMSYDYLAKMKPGTA